MVRNVNNRVSKFFMYPSPSFSGRTVPLFDSMLVPQGEGSGIPTVPHHTPSPEAQQTSPTTHSSPSLPHVPTEPLPTVIPTYTPQLRHYTKRARIAQSSALPPVADKPASPTRDDSQGEACLTDSGLEAYQDRANIPKTSTLPSDSTPRVTSLAADEGSMQQKLDELTALYTSLQRQQSEMVSKFEAQELEINSLKARIKLLEDKDGGVAEQSGDDAPIKGRRLDEVEEEAEGVSDDTEEMATVLTSMDAACILTSGGVQVVPTATEVATATRLPHTQEEKVKKQWLNLKHQRRRRKQQKEFYMSVLKSHAGWKARHFKGMTLEEVKEKFDPIWKQFQDFIPIGSKEEAERCSIKFRGGLFGIKCTRHSHCQLWSFHCQKKFPLPVKKVPPNEEKRCHCCEVCTTTKVKKRVISPRRTKLTPTSVEVCICLKDHLDSMERIQHQSRLEGELEQVEEQIHEEEIAINLADPIDEEE
nr:zinc finger BED domain-containing protein RICESLEEPER 2 [Tanacetum cinerariifolium]